MALRTYIWPLAAALLWAVAPVLAQTKPTTLPGNYPNKPIRVIVPASPGGGTDIVSRIVAQRLAERWGSAVVIENRGSAVGGIIGMDIASKATPDGYTLLAVSASAVLNAALVNKTAYDQRVAFVPIVQLTTQPYLLAVTASLPAQSVGELVALAKAKPGAFNCGSAGNGSMSHLGCEMFNAPEMLEKFAGDGSEPAPGTPEQLRELFNRDIDKWSKLFARMKVKL